MTDEPMEFTRDKRRQGAGKSYGKIAKVGAIWTVLRQIGKHGIAIPTSMVMARLLTPTEFGVTAAAGFFLLMANRTNELGLNAALVRAKNLRPEHNSSVFLFAMALGVVAWLALTVSAPWVGVFFRSPDVGHVLTVTAFMFLITPWSTVPSAMLQRQLRFKAISLADWFDSVISSSVAIVLAWWGFSFWSLVYSQLAAAAVHAAVKITLTRWRPSLRFSWPALRELLSFGVGLQVKRFLEFAAGNLDNLLIGRFIGITALGLYDKAFMTTQRLQHTLNLGPAVSFRIFAIIQDDDARFRRAYQKILLTVGLVAMPPLILCVVIAPQLFEVMYGARWLACVPAFQVLCVATIVKLISAHATQANEAKGQIWRQVWQKVPYVAMIVLGVWIGSYWGITGAACGVLVARLVLAVLVQRLLRESINGTWREMLMPLVPGVVLATVTAGVALATEALVRLWLPASPPLTLLSMQAVVAGLAYASLVIFSPFKAVRDVVRETVQDFAPRLVKWLPGPISETQLTKVG